MLSAAIQTTTKTINKHERERDKNVFADKLKFFVFTYSRCTIASYKMPCGFIGPTSVSLINNKRVKTTQIITL